MQKVKQRRKHSFFWKFLSCNKANDTKITSRRPREEGGENVNCLSYLHFTYYIALIELIKSTDMMLESNGSFTLCVFIWLRLRFLLSQQMVCTGLNGSVHTMRLEQHHQLLYSPLWTKPNRSHKSHSVNGPLPSVHKIQITNSFSQVYVFPVLGESLREKSLHCKSYVLCLWWCWLVKGKCFIGSPYDV